MSDTGPPPLAAYPFLGTGAAEGAEGSELVGPDVADVEGSSGPVRYGPLVADEGSLRLLGNVAGRRVLLLGTGVGRAAAVLARGGARVIAVEPSEAAVAATRARCAAEGHSVDVRHAGLAELAFVRAGTVDVALSIFALTVVPDLTRVFRQVHRVLRPEAPVVVSLPHPLLSLVVEGSDGLTLDGRYGAPGATTWTWRGQQGQDHRHTVEAVTTALVRAAFRPDVLLELAAEPAAGSGDTAGGWWRPALGHLPAVLVVRARRVGL